MDLTLAGVTLHVADVDRSLAFYENFPGAEVVFHMPGRSALLRFGTGRLHLEVECGDLEATYTKFQKLGIPTEGPPTVRGWGERDFLVIDPDGNLVEVGQRRTRPPTQA